MSMNLSRHSNFALLGLFGICGSGFLSHVNCTLPSKAGNTYAQKHLKTSQILISGLGS